MNVNVKTDLWHYLADCGRPIVMYGMGNGADKILKICDRYRINVSDFFASDGFVRGHSFHGKRVLAYSEMKEKYADLRPIVLLSFASSLESVIELFRGVAQDFEFYAPDVPVFGETLFDLDFFESNRERFERIYSLLADEESRSIYENVINYKLTGRIDYLFAAESDKDKVYRELLDCENLRDCVDVGAYNGDTLRELVEYCSDLKSVVSLEPDARNFRKLSEYASSLQDKLLIECINAGAWNENTILSFDGSGNRNSGILTDGRLSKKATDARMITLDSILCGRSPDYIKYDVEGSEKEAIEGSELVIKSSHPKLLISLYHRSEDMFALPEQILSISPDYKLYIRRFRYIPAWDLNLYAIK